MDNIKVSLTIKLQGRMMGSKQICLKNIKTHKKYYKTEPVYSECRQVINITNEAYNTMTDRKIVPSWSKPVVWNSCGKEARLRQHFERIQADLGGISFEYNILDD